jgi:hypothetical protein
MGVGVGQSRWMDGRTTVHTGVRYSQERFSQYRKRHLQQNTPEAQDTLSGDAFETGRGREKLEAVPLFRGCEVGFLHMLALKLKAC